ncbi:MAG: sigma-70 family RNA polymerase sigma factor [bacterium]
MAAGLGKSLQAESERVQQALDLIFAFFDQCKTYQENPPPEVQQAFAVIVPYFNKRICGSITPRRWGYLSGGAKPQDLHQEAWAKFWKCGADINMRTVAGVFSWLRKVILNRILDELRKHLHLEMIEEGEYQKRNSGDNRLAHFLTDFEILGGGTSDEKQYRFDLLCKFFEKALPKLSARQREVICLSQAGKSVPEITKLMSFATKNALSNFKRRAYQKLAYEMYRGFLSELKNPRADFLHRHVIETWLTRFQKRGAREKCLIATR